MPEEKDLFESLFEEKLHDVELPVSQNLWNRISVSIAFNRTRKILWLLVAGFVCVIIGFMFFQPLQKRDKNVSVVSQRTSENKVNEINSTTSSREIEKEHGDDEHANNELDKKPAPLGSNRQMKSEQGKNQTTSEVQGKENTASNSVHAANPGKTNDKENGAVTKALASKKNAGGNNSGMSNRGEGLKKSVKNGSTTASTNKKDKAVNNAMHPNAEEKKTDSAIQTSRSSSGQKNNSDRVNAADKKRSETNPESMGSLANKNMPDNSSDERKPLADKNDSAPGVQDSINGLSVNSIKEPTKEEVAPVSTLDTISAQVVHTNDTMLAKVANKPVDALSQRNPEAALKNHFGFFAGVENGTLLPSVTASTRGYTLQNSGGSFSGLSYVGMLNLGVTFKNKLRLVAGIGVSKLSANYSKAGTIDTSYMGFPIKQEYILHVIFNSSFINIPISLEYAFGLGKKCAITPSVGIVFNKLMDASVVINNSITPETMSNPTSDFRPFTTSWQAGFRFEYLVTDKWRISLAPTYGRFSSNLFKDGDLYKISPAYFNLTFGLRYYFR